MREEILRILKMVEEGKVTSEQGVQLVEALGLSDQNSSIEKDLKDEQRKVISSEEREAFMNSGTSNVLPGQKMLQVRVLSGEGDKVKVNLPLSFVQGVLKVSGKMPMIKSEQMEGIDMKELTEAINAAIENDLTGRLVDVESANGDFVVVEII